MSKKHLNAAKVLSLITGEREYPTLFCSSSSEVDEEYVSGSRKRDLMAQIKKIEFFMLIKRYNLYQLSAKILEGKTFDTQRNWQLKWALFSKAIELEIEKT